MRCVPICMRVCVCICAQFRQRSLSSRWMWIVCSFFFPCIRRCNLVNCNRATLSHFSSLQLFNSMWKGEINKRNVLSSWKPLFACFNCPTNWPIEQMTNKNFHHTNLVWHNYVLKRTNLSLQWVCVCVCTVACAWLWCLNSINDNCINSIEHDMCEIQWKLFYMHLFRMKRCRLNGILWKLTHSINVRLIFIRKVYQSFLFFG